MRTLSILWAMVAIGLTSCTTLPSSKALISGTEESSLRMADFPSERRGAWIVTGRMRGNVSICSEPFSDTGLSTQQLMKLTADLADKGKLGIDNSTISTLSELKGRSPSVLALRDVMYRMCERRLSAPGGDIPQVELDVYKSIVAVIGDFARADRKDAETNEAEVKQMMRARSAGGAATRAGDAQSRGFRALAKCDWEAAEQAFSEAEAAMPGYQTSYEYARALRLGADKKEKRNNAVAVDSAFLSPEQTKSLRNCDGT